MKSYYLTIKYKLIEYHVLKKSHPVRILEFLFKIIY